MAIVSKIRVLGQKELQGGRQTHPSPSLFRVKSVYDGFARKAHEKIQNILLLTYCNFVYL